MSELEYENLLNKFQELENVHKNQAEENEQYKGKFKWK